MNGRIIRLAGKDARIETSGWTIQTEAGALPPDGDIIVPMSVWLQNVDALTARNGRIGVWLAPAEDPGALKDAFAGLSLIAIQFPKFTDGRGYSIAALLRRRYGWTGEIRAIGDVLRDQLFYMARAGFDSFALAEGRDIEAAMDGFKDFSVVYQDSSDGKAPALRTRAQAVRDAKIIRAAKLLAHIAEQHPSAALASSLSAEDMVLTDLIARNALPIHIFTLQTGRLHEETLGMIGKTKARYGIDIEPIQPVAAAVEAHVSAHGDYAFYDSLELRKACCGIRKVEPLNRALKGRTAWITGQRRDQSVTRTTLHEEEHDADRGIAKFNPLADWTWDDVLAYAAAHDVPLNPLHARGYPSIGCEPCTRAIRPGEDPRAGRWWWEQSDSKECGLHTHTDEQPSLESVS
jgi:phosphoadenosine phosphosulfate reductase